MKKVYSIGGVILLIAALFAGYEFFHKDSNESVGAVSYPSALSAFPNGVQEGGGAYQQGLIESGVNSTSTSQTAYTLSGNDIIGFSSLFLTPITGGLALTLPASSTISGWLPNAGDFTTFILFNGTTTVGSAGNITLAAGTGSLLEVASSTGTAIIPLLSQSKGSEINVFRKANSDLVFMFSSYF